MKEPQEADEGAHEAATASDTENQSHDKTHATGTMSGVSNGGDG